MATERQTGRPRIAVIALTPAAGELATRLTAGLAGTSVLTPGPKVAETLARHWREFDGFVCIMATGIVVRAIAPLLADKRRDPAVVVVDELGCHAISLLSGHLGGANDLARRVAELLGGKAIITTASDLRGHTALDLWAREHGLFAADPVALTAASASLLAQGFLMVYSEVGPGPWPDDLRPAATPAIADLLISNRFCTEWPGAPAGGAPLAAHSRRASCPPPRWPRPPARPCARPRPNPPPGERLPPEHLLSSGRLILHPRNLVVGIGCNRGTPAVEIRAALAASLARAGLAGAAVRNLATHKCKRDETGLIAYAEAEGLPIIFYPSEELNQVTGVTRSAAAHRATGAWSVAEAAARLSAASDNLLIRKEKWPNLTIAIAEAKFSWSAWDRAAAPI